jgi:outer membrane lipoprotein LolB
MDFARLLAVLLSLALAVLLAGCASLAPPTPKAASAGQRSMSGRISVQYKDAESGRQEAFHGRFDWLQDGDSIDITLLDPLGQSVALLHTDSAAGLAAPASTLTLRDGRTFSGRTPEDLSERTLGWRLPATGLGYWLEGRKAPGSTAEIDANPAGTPGADASSGTPRGLVQDGWTVRYPDSNSGTPPRRVDLSFTGGRGEIELRLVIDSRDPGRP